MLSVRVRPAAAAGDLGGASPLFVLAGLVVGNALIPQNRSYDHQGERESRGIYGAAVSLQPYVSASHAVLLSLFTQAWGIWLWAPVADTRRGPLAEVRMIPGH